MSNAIDKLRAALGVEADNGTIMTVVSTSNGMAELHGYNKVFNVSGNWQIGTRLIVKSGVVQSVVVDSGVVIYGE